MLSYGSHTGRHWNSRNGEQMLHSDEAKTVTAQNGGWGENGKRSVSKHLIFDRVKTAVARNKVKCRILSIFTMTKAKMSPGLQGSK